MSLTETCFYLRLYGSSITTFSFRTTQSCNKKKLLQTYHAGLIAMLAYLPCWYNKTKLHRYFTYATFTNLNQILLRHVASGDGRGGVCPPRFWQIRTRRRATLLPAPQINRFCDMPATLNSCEKYNKFMNFKPLN